MLQGRVLEDTCDDNWVFDKGGKTDTPRWGYFFPVFGHGEAAPGANAGPAAFQGRVLEGACDGDLVFDKDGKTRTSRWMSG